MIYHGGKLCFEFILIFKKGFTRHNFNPFTIYSFMSNLFRQFLMLYGILKLSYDFDLKSDSVVLAMDLVDRFIAVRPSATTNPPQYVAVCSAAVILATRLVFIKHFSVFNK